MCVLSCMTDEIPETCVGWGSFARVRECFEIEKSCVFRPLDRRQASGHTLRCVRYEPTVIYNLVQPPGNTRIITIPNNYYNGRQTFR